MEGLFFLLSCIGIGLLASWMMQNSRVGPHDQTVGLFAMPSKDSDEFDKSTEPSKTARRQITRARRRG